jgi:hypothetical protein
VFLQTGAGMYGERYEYNEEALFICSAVLITFQSLSSILMTCLSSPTSSKHHLPLPLTSIIESYLPPIKEWWHIGGDGEKGPKRALSAYMFFSKVRSSQIKEETGNLNMSFDELSTRCW